MTFDPAAWRRGQAQQAAADRQHAAKMKALDAKKSGGGGRGGSGGRFKNSGGGRAGGRATRGQGSWTKAGKVPALLLKIHAGGRYGDRYAELQKGSQFIDSNMLGKDALDRADELDLDAARHPGVNPKNLFVHLSLSRPSGEDLTPKQWKNVARQFLKNIGAEGCQFVCTRHTETKNDHLHLIFSRSRVNPDGSLSLVSMSNNRWAWRAAVRQVETELGITAADRPADVNRPVAATSDRQVNAARRAARRGTAAGHIDPAVISPVLALASTPEQFAAGLEAAGILVKAAEKNGKTTGILFQKIGAKEWLAGSSISREFSLPKIRQALLKNEQEIEIAIQQRQRAPLDRQRQQAQPIQYPRERY